MKKFLSLFFISLSCFARQDRPNILFIVSEDNGYDYMSFNGNKHASCPALDGLAKEGIVFDRAYSNGAVCAVSRSTMITGMYASSLGTTHMRSSYPVPDFIDTYAKLFKEAGYFAGNYTKTDYNTSSFGKNVWTSSSPNTYFKKSAGTPEKDKPFIAVFSLIESHESKIFPDPKKAFFKSGKKMRVSPDDVDLAPFYLDTPEQREDIAFYYECLSAMDSKVKNILDQLEKDGTKDDTFIIYASDHGGILPRSKRYLEDTGTHIPLIVVVPKNWQEYAIGEAGSRSDMLISLVDIPPTMLSIAGIDVPEYMEGKAFLGKSKAAELNKYAYFYSGRYDGETNFCFRRGISDGTYRYIRDFMSFVPYALNCEYPYRQDGATAWAEEFEKGNLNKEQAMYFSSLGTADILYNTSEDKWEMNNIAQSSLAKLKEMKEALYNIMLETKDAGIYPEPFFYDMKAGDTIYDIMRAKDFDYKAALDIAWKSGERNPSDLAYFKEALKNENRVVRYWAVVGLANLKDPSAIADLQSSMQNDTEVANRITACLALNMINKSPENIDFFKSVSDSYIKGVEPNASINKIAFLKNFAEGALAVSENRIPFIGAMEYLKTYGLSPACVNKNPAPEIRKIGAAKASKKTSNKTESTTNAEGAKKSKKKKKK